MQTFGYLVGASFRRHGAIVQDDDALAEAACFRELMSAQQHGVLFAKASDEFSRIHHLDGVYAHGGFVQYEYLRFVQHGLCESEPLAVSPG